MPARGSTRRALDGVLLLDKPAGATSNAVLQRVRWLYNAAKAGHTGTLDPFATGLLPICFGEATKFAGYLLDATKSYRALVRFGLATDTQDADGRAVGGTTPAFTEAGLRATLARFTGPQRQVPPAYSALKRDGRPYYEYARAGIEIERAPRDVTVETLTLVSYAAPDAWIDVTCSKGTYVRTLAADIGAALGCGAHLAALRRTQSGGFRLADAVDLAAIEAAAPAARDAWLLPLDVLVAALPHVAAGADAARRFAHGQPVPADAALAGPVAVYDGGRLLGVGDAAGGSLQPRRLVACEPTRTP
ncbi:MAG: tRNA pseudouridine(55) synthase TruB [Proteobacteria bacterium]|nr:tRNA pseudouridine(55) synthase TruB [Pseudomonadota bacterium]